MTKLKVVIYGNCHTSIIKEMLNSFDDFRNNYEIQDILMICDIKDPYYFNNPIFSACDVFIHQSIRKENSYGEAYSSDNIICKLKKSCRVIAIPNVYHLPTCFFPQYKEEPEYKIKGITYFFRDAIIDSKTSKSFTNIQEIIKDYKNPFFYDNSQIIQNFKAFIDKIKIREKDWDIKVSDFIINFYKDHQLFYDPNHPTNYFFAFVVNELIKILFQNNKYALCDFNINKRLDNIEIPVCESVRHSLGLNWSNEHLRNSKPYTSYAIGKMNLDSYIRQYLSIRWTEKNCPQFIFIKSKFIWSLRWFLVKSIRTYKRFHR